MKKILLLDTINADGNVNILATRNSIIFAGQEPT
jgi:hypothetical protein